MAGGHGAPDYPTGEIRISPSGFFSWTRVFHVSFHIHLTPFVQGSGLLLVDGMQIQSIGRGIQHLHWCKCSLKHLTCITRVIQ